MRVRTYDAQYGYRVHNPQQDGKRDAGNLHGARELSWSELVQGTVWTSQISASIMSPALDNGRSSGWSPVPEIPSIIGNQAALRAPCVSCFLIPRDCWSSDFELLIGGYLLLAPGCTTRLPAPLFFLLLFTYRSRRRREVCTFTKKPVPVH